MAKRDAKGTSNSKPKARDLPGLEDRAIKPLEEAAEAYADIRDQRMELGRSETELKSKLLTLMKKHGKSTYHRNGITIDIVSEAETVKVRVKKGGDDDQGEGTAAEA